MKEIMMFPKSEQLSELYETRCIKKLALFAATWKDLEIIISSEVSQKEKEKYHMTSLIRGI